MRNAFRLSLLALAAMASIPSARGESPRYQRRWLYSMFNLQVNESADRVVALIDRASRAGYNGLILADYKLNILDRVPDHYFKNVERVRKAAEKAGIEIIPAVFPIGYSDGLLAHDPNLAEGLPAEATFGVAGGKVSQVKDSRGQIKNGGLEDANGDTFAGFGFQDDPGKASFADREIVHGGKVSCRMQDTSRTSTDGNCRLIQKVAVRPRGCYRFSCWVKTKDLGSPGNFHLNVIGAGPNGRQLVFHEGGIEPTRDWTRVSVVFNSIDQEEVNLYVGLWGGSTGTVWVDDLELERLALVNVLRREGCPVVVKQGETVMEEGHDFEPIADPTLGQVPYAGEYEFDHEGPTLKLTKGSRIRPGAMIQVSYYHPILTHGSQVMCCPSEPKVYELLRDQARRVNDLLHPKTFFMGFDEVRVMNWCGACQSRKRTSGQLLADCARKATAILKGINPKAEVVTWSDMFDPNHNAVKAYYLVNGTLEGSWEGLPKEVIIANWNGGQRAPSLRFFSDRGHRQVVAGYYDAGLENFRRWDEASQRIPDVIGFLYTTWQARYDDLEAFGEAMRRAK